MNSPALLRLFCFALLFLGLVATCAPQQTNKNAAASPEPWKSKDWTQWTKADCEKVLSDSPWSHTEYRWCYSHFYSAMAYCPDQEREGVMTFCSVDGGQVKCGKTVIQILSAPPVRHALIRQQQLKINYDQLDAVGREMADRKILAKLGPNSPDEIVIRVTEFRQETRIEPEILLYLLSDRVRICEPNIRLEGRYGEYGQGGCIVRPIQRFDRKRNVGNEMVDLVYPRTFKGQPLFGPGTFSVQLLFGKQRKHPKGASPGTVVFRVAHEEGVPSAGLVDKAKQEN